MPQKKITGNQIDTAISQLSNVFITSLQDSDILVRDGSRWVNRPINNAEFSATLITSTAAFNSVVSTTSDANLIPNNLTTIPFNNAVFDMHGWFNDQTPGRVTVPSGYGLARFVASIKWSGSVALDNRTTFYMQLFKNGSYQIHSGVNIMYVADRYVQPATSTTLQNLTLDTGWIPVSAGSYFEVKVTHLYHTSNISIPQAWLSIEGK